MQGILVSAVLTLFPFPFPARGYVIGIGEFCVSGVWSPGKCLSKGQHLEPFVQCTDVGFRDSETSPGAVLQKRQGHEL